MTGGGFGAIRTDPILKLHLLEEEGRHMFHVLKCKCSMDFHFELVFDGLSKYWKIGLPAYRSCPSNLFLTQLTIFGLCN